MREESKTNAWYLILAALTMTVLEGAVRKWVFPADGVMKYLLYFSKDILFAGLLLLPRLNPRKTVAMNAFESWLQPGCVILALGIILSSISGVNPVGALLTFRALIFLPIMALLAVPRLTGLPFKWIIWLVTGLTVLNFFLGIEQNRLPADHILNRYADAEMQVVEVDSGVRASGTFAYITGITVISAFGIWAGLAMMSIAKSRSQQVLAWLALAGGFGCGLVSVSRGPIVVGVAMIATWLLGMKKGITLITRGLGMGIICLVGAFALGLSSTFVQLTEGLVQRNEMAGDSLTDRSTGQFRETFAAIQMAPGGAGFGTQQVGGTYYISGKAGFASFESPLPRLVLETGILGLIGYVIVCVGAIVALEAAKKQTAQAGRKGIFLATQILLVPMFYGAVIFNHTASAFSWMIFASVLAAVEEGSPATTHPQLRRREKSQLREQHA